MENKDKKIITLLVVFTIIFAVIGSTLAYFSWVSSEEQQTSVTFTATSDFSCSADGGGNITSSDVMLAPSTCMNSEYAIQREVKVMPTINSTGKTVYMDLWLDVNVLETGLSESENFMYALTTDENSCSTGVVSTGTFNGLATGDKVNLFEGKEYTTTTTDTYYLYIWLDAEETSSNTMDQDFDLSLGGNCADSNSMTSIPNAPLLDNGGITPGMIPVIISDDGTVTTVSDSDSSWYNYDEKRWANAVLVKTSGTQTRSYYQENLGNNVTVSQNDILAYFVWIPRYKYKIWDTTETSSPQTINIVFQSTEDEVETGTQVGEYRTHPAFWWDDNSDGERDDGEEISGIWVGKFETTQGTSDNVGTDNPTVLPNAIPWVSQNVSTQFETGLKFSASSTSSNYGIVGLTISHMMKNSEWGAVAYLSHSIYGINEQIRLNSYYNSGYLTGCGASYDGQSNYTSCAKAYGKYSDYPQSTTGNITGIFDMSGGVAEYVMGVFANSSGSLWSGASSSSNSGFSGKCGTSGTSCGNKSFPQSKYFDTYKATSGTTISVTTGCNGGVCYGHALSETSGWYRDSNNFVSSSAPWFRRGGMTNDTTYTGVFNYSIDGGAAFGGTGFRTVLVTQEI